MATRLVKVWPRRVTRLWHCRLQGESQAHTSDKWCNTGTSSTSAHRSPFTSVPGCWKSMAPTCVRGRSAWTETVMVWEPLCPESKAELANQNIRRRYTISNISNQYTHIYYIYMLLLQFLAPRWQQMHLGRVSGCMQRSWVHRGCSRRNSSVHTALRKLSARVQVLGALWTSVGQERIVPYTPWNWSNWSELNIGCNVVPLPGTPKRNIQKTTGCRSGIFLAHQGDRRT